MSPGASVAVQYLRVQNPCEANRTVMKDSKYSLEFGRGKHLGEQRSVMQDLLLIKPQMMLKLLSSKMLSVDLAHVNPQTNGLQTQSEASRHAEMMELFPLSTSFGSNSRLKETNISLPSSQCVVAQLSGKPSSAQLTIFYKGAVNVYDMHADKADMEIVKKLSLKRFLQKRKERFNSVAPYAPWRG